MNGQYFTDSDIEKVREGLFGLTSMMTLAAGNAADTSDELKATYSLHTLGLLRSRLDAPPRLLEIMYGMQDVVPEPVKRLLSAYSAGDISREVTDELIDDLQQRLVSLYAAEGLDYPDPSVIPKGPIMPVFGGEGPMADMSRLEVDRIRMCIADTLREKAPQVHPSDATREIYEAAFWEDFGVLDLQKLVTGVAEHVHPSCYMQVMLSMGTLNPTRERFALEYWRTLESVTEALGIMMPPALLFDEEAIVAERLSDAVYAKELAAYDASLEGLLLR